MPRRVEFGTAAALLATPGLIGEAPAQEGRTWTPDVRITDRSIDGG